MASNQLFNTWPTISWSTRGQQLCRWSTRGQQSADQHVANNQLINTWPTISWSTCQLANHNVANNHLINTWPTISWICQNRLKRFERCKLYYIIISIEPDPDIGVSNDNLILHCRDLPKFNMKRSGRSMTSYNANVWRVLLQSAADLFSLQFS